MKYPKNMNSATKYSTIYCSLCPLEWPLKKTNGTCQLTNAVENLSGQPLIETWVAHRQPSPFWISEYLW
jgi:hypothetical protein